MSHDRCNHTPAERAQADQDAAGFRDGLAAIVRLARQWLAEGDDDVHAAARIDVSSTLTFGARQISALLGFAVLRVIELEDAVAQRRMSDGEFEDWQANRDVVDERTRDAATPPPPSTQENP